MKFPRPTRRLFRFSLRTLFVLVTLLCIYLGWAMNWQRQRQVFLKSANVELVNESWFPGDPSAPWSLRLLNEPGIVNICYNCPDQEQLLRASKLFPEAKIQFMKLSKSRISNLGLILCGITAFRPLHDPTHYQNGNLYREDFPTSTFLKTQSHRVHGDK